MTYFKNLFLDESKWFLSTFLPGKKEITTELSTLSNKMCLLPQVSVASCLSEDLSYKGEAFCCLPLPKGSAQAKTGLPIHVNAYFGLTDNRRALKWTDNDQKNDASARYFEYYFFFILFYIDKTKK